MNHVSGSTSKPVHLAWVDYLRIAACFLVIISHCGDPFVAQFDANRTEFLSGAAWGSLVRCCVPLFVMISGVLLLPVNMDMGVFYKKRLKKIIIPLVLWSIATPLLYQIYFSVVTTSSPCIDAAQFTWSAALMKMWTFIFNFNYDTTPLWYVYMLIGLYLFMPIISAWLKQAQQRDIKIFLGIWIASLCAPYVHMLAPLIGYQGNFGNMGILGVCDWNAYGSLYYFSGFLGYLVLAYYLIKYPLNWSIQKTIGISTALFMLGYAITLAGFIYTQKHYPGQFAKLEIIWLFSGINICLMTFSVFILFQKLKIKATPFIQKTAALTFGIFLCHFLFVQMMYDALHGLIPLPAWALLPIMATCTFIMALAVSWLLSLTPWTKKAVM